MFPKKAKLVFLDKMTQHTKGDHWIPMTFVGIRATNLQLQTFFEFFCQIMNE
jgi:hypothetical protein